MSAAIRYIDEHPHLHCEVVDISPAIASRMLERNLSNRPLRRKQVDYLRLEIREGHWRLNGEPIIISVTGEVLDGQHRLAAISQESSTVPTLVVRGVPEDAFHTIDTGVSRTKSDALYFTRRELTARVISAASSAVLWCKRLEQHSVTCTWRISNQDVTSYIEQYPRLIDDAELLNKYPRENRPVSGGPALALLEMFSRKDREMALQFMHLLFTGESLVRTDVHWLLRHSLIQASTRVAKLQTQARIRMVVKGWNWLRRGNTRASPAVIALSTRDSTEVVIL